MEARRAQAEEVRNAMAHFQCHGLNRGILFGGLSRAILIGVARKDAGDAQVICYKRMGGDHGKESCLERLL